MIKIYKDEAGMADVIMSNASIAYQAEIIPLSSDVARQERIKAGLANWLDNITEAPAHGGEQDSDLHYVQSVLVTTNWNLNDDIFDPKEVWVARHTPEHKPTNIGHDEHEIVGHMTTNWVMDAEGTTLDDSTPEADLPDLFHVVNGSVIYQAWQDEKLITRAQRLIEEIDAGQKFVSMECMFTGFDYAVLTGDNQSRVVARSDETSFLTKHLRAYGGTGLYEGFKIGRLLRGITFTGKGFVDKPANPDSIIFDKNKFFDFSKAEQQTVFITDSDKNSVCISTDNNSINEEISMTDVLTDYNAELKAQNADLTQQLADATKQLARSDIEQVEKKMVKLQDELNTSKSHTEELEAKMADSSTKIEDMTKELAEVQTVRDALQSEMDEVKANEIHTNRVSSLVDGGIDKEMAVSKVDLYKDLSDEQFADLSSELIEVAKIKASQTTEEVVEDTEEVAETVEADEVVDEVSDEEADDAEAEVEVLDSVEADEDADLSVADDSDQTDDIRSKLSRAISECLGHSNETDSE